MIVGKREDLMPHYLFQWKYKDPAIQAMIETPQDRSAELRKAVEAFGGRMHQFFFALACTMALASSSSRTTRVVRRAL
jgi:uncharacterized protein with GYD domain